MNRLYAQESARPIDDRSCWEKCRGQRETHSIVLQRRDTAFRLTPRRVWSLLPALIEQSVCWIEVGGSRSIWLRKCTTQRTPAMAYIRTKRVGEGRRLQASGYLLSSTAPWKYSLGMGAAMATVNDPDGRFHIHGYGKWFDLDDSPFGTDWIGCGLSQPQRPFVSSSHLHPGSFDWYHDGVPVWNQGGHALRLNGEWTGYYIVYNVDYGPGQLDAMSWFPKATSVHSSITHNGTYWWYRRQVADRLYVITD